MGKAFVVKHVRTKHADKLEEVRAKVSGMHAPQREARTGALLHCVRKVASYHNTAALGHLVHLACASASASETDVWLLHVTSLGSSN